MRANRFIVQATLLTRCLAALGSGALAVFAMPPFGLSPVLLISFPVLVWLLDNVNKERQLRARIIQAALIGFVFGFAFFLGSVHWIGEAFLVDVERYGLLMPFAILGLSLGLAIFPAIALGLAGAFWSTSNTRVLWLACAFSFVEWLRGHVLTGFPWNAMGYALSSSEALMQMAAYIGLYGLTFFVVFVSALPALLVAPLERRGQGRLNRVGITAVLGSAAIIAMIWAGGSFRLRAAPLSFVPGVNIRIVQPAVDQKLKWSPEQAVEIFEHFMTLSSREGLEKITHVVWPESALPFFLDGNKPVLSRIDALLPDQTFLITGAMRLGKGERGQENYFNSIEIFDGSARKVAHYDKFHLVPFGEYLPLGALLSKLGFRALVHSQGGFTPGPGLRTLIIPNAPPLGALVCYEAIFPGAVARDDVRPGWLVNVTNDAWFGDSLGPPQHLAQARMRAVEEGLPVIRAANTGISAVIDAEGRVRARLGINTTGVIDFGLPKPRQPTFYAHFADLPFWLIIIFSGGFYGFYRLRRPRR